MTHWFRKHLITKIRYAIEKSATAKDELDHRAMKGRLSEIFVQELIEPLLPNGVKAATGLVIDSTGKKSNQIDVIVYSTSILPSFMEMQEQIVVPVEACLQVFEIKSKLDASEVKDSIKKARSIKELRILKGNHTFVVPPIFSLLALDTDLTGNRKTEWERYIENKPSDLRNNMLFNEICVVGHGYWTLDNKASPVHVEPTNEYDEMISMLIRCTNSIQHWIRYRGYPLFGNYLQ